MNSIRSVGMALAIAGNVFSTSTQGEDLVPATATWRYLPGKSEASLPGGTDWRQDGYNDSAWASGPAPFFFGEPLTGTELNDMADSYSSLYLRHTFQVSDPNAVGALTLLVQGDDGYVVWLNGTEVARFNVAAGELPYNSLAGPALPEPLNTDSYSIREPWKALKSGKNIVAIHALNSTLGGPDFLISASLQAEAAPKTGPVVVDLIPPARSTLEELDAVEVFFSTPVQGVDAEDLLVNGNPTSGVRQFGPTHYVFSITNAVPGTATLTWRTDHRITDIQGVPQPFAGGTWTLQIDPTTAAKKIYISEFMADNDKTLFDEDCENSDWIEIFNSGSTAVNLAGWSLTDEAGRIGKWRFPDHTLEGGSYFVVFASQKDRRILTNVFGTLCRTRTNKLTGFHTNFRLSDTGEYLALAAPDGEIISEFSPRYAIQRRDVSYGRVPGSDRYGYLGVPTPGKANSSGGDGFTPEVQFSHSTGTFLEPFDLKLSCVDTNAIIRFTLDGTLPVENGAATRVYEAPISIRTVTQVRARAYSPNLLPSAPHTETFLALTNAAVNRATLTSSLPIIVVTTLRNVSITAQRNTPVQMSFYEPLRGRSAVTNPPTLVTRGALKVRGSSTEGQPQSNFAVDLWDDFDQDHDLSPFGMPEDSEFVLYAPNQYDAALIHNPFTMVLSHQMGSIAPRTRFVEVYLNKGGVLASNQWQGLYVWMEKPGLSKGRVDAPKAQPEDVTEPSITGSYLFKTDRLDTSGGDRGFNAGGSLNAYVEPKESEMRTLQRQPQVMYLSNYFRSMDNALRPTNPDYRDPVKGYKAYIDTTNWVDFHILETLSGQADAIRLSTYFYKRRNGKMEYGPRWDYDRAWESKADDRDNNPRIWDTGGGLWGPPWWGNFLRDTDAWQVWVDRYQGFRKGPLSLANMYSVMDQMTNEIRFAQPRENVRWRDTAPRLSYRNEISIMKTWISNRVTWLDNQMAQPPILSSAGGPVTSGYVVEIKLPVNISSAANAQIYYTLDGTDPRPPQGTNPITSLRYTGPITITNNTRIFARVRDSGRAQRSGPPSTTIWSSAALATFVVTPPPLVLTELMFHPTAPSGSLDDENEYEFIELLNVSGKELDLNNYHFTSGIEYRFSAASDVRMLAPGGRVLLVRNRSAFSSRYPGVGNIAGEFLGGLSDSGERLALAGPVEEPIFDITYNDSWQPLADGLGFSLVPVDETLPPSALKSSAYWRLSARTGGSPGQKDPERSAIPRVVVSEIQPEAQALGDDSQVELQNLESTVSDISGWWLSDDFKDPRKARIPANSRINANGYLVLREAVFNLPNGAGFQLSPLGESLWLFSADIEGNLTGWYHGFRYGVTEPNQSYGRHITSTGTEVYPLQNTPSIGAANTEPVVGPVIFGEIFYHPAEFDTYENSADEFVEIRNVTESTVPLFDPVRPTNTWRLRGDVDLNFPMGLTIPGRGRLIIVGFDPVQYPATLESLRRRAGLAVSTAVVGPWSGSLGNSLGTVRLERPGAPVIDGNVISVRYSPVDQVEYQDNLPWPREADGTGASLVRRGSSSYGGDPHSWYAANRIQAGIDLDDDGLPDDWELANGLSPLSAGGTDGGDGDLDGDGFTNRHELLNGTDPRDPSSGLRLRVGYGAGAFVNLFLSASTSRKFRLESRNSLTAGSWTSAGEVTSDSSGSGFLQSLPATADPIYYRLQKLE